jgi:hypothetical protein
MSLAELTEAVSKAKTIFLSNNEVIVRRIEKKGEGQTTRLDVLLDYNIPMLAWASTILDVIISDFKYVFNSVGIHVDEISKPAGIFGSVDAYFIGIPERHWEMFRLYDSKNSEFNVSISIEDAKGKIACHYEPHELLDAYYARLEKLLKPEEKKDEPAAEEL